MRPFLALTVLALGAGWLSGAGPAPTSADRPVGTIAFASLAPRGWDVYLTDIPTGQARRLTDHPALDYNAALAPDGKRVAFVSERDGNLQLYSVGVDGSGLRRLTHEFALDDHPAWSPDGRQIAFVSTRRPAREVGRAWNGIYVMNADGSAVRRLSGEAADYSPSYSPPGARRGDRIAFASGSGVAGGTDLYVMKPDGSGRQLVVKDGGWPSFSADGEALYFHSRRQGRWGVYRVHLDGTGLERLTPLDLDAYTPRASADGKWLVLAVRREGHRQIERMDLATRKLQAVTHDPADHWNPAPSADGSRVVYHKATPGLTVPNVERWGSPPGTGLVLLRLAGAFPGFAPDGKRLALTGGNFSQVDVMNSDGSGRRTVHQGKGRSVFSMAWSRHGDWIAFAVGPTFAGAGDRVDLAAVRPDGTGYRKLTKDAGNNGFPAFSPDGRQLVFRSGRGGEKNLYIMNRDGTGLRRLTKGRWTDTMADWSPTGEWIVFASDRDGDFEVWLVHPDGSGLHKLVAGGGRNNHPHFAPDGRWVVFTSQRAGYSAEEASLPHQFQPYGELFAVRVDGTDLLRLTHNGYEEGTPAWGPATAGKVSGAGAPAGADY
jgi:Tol biopolymer transport system component